MSFRAAILAGAIALGGCATLPQTPEVRSATTSAADADEQYIAELVSRMSLERKVAQLIQPQINSFTAEDMERYRFGSYLNGGNGGPYGDEFAPASEMAAPGRRNVPRFGQAAAQWRARDPDHVGDRRGPWPHQCDRRDHLPAQHRVGRNT
ncbi:hypothetical protein [Altererythrobacter sp. BO-6]|uniref:hypothetical protein n=1 Tax=Altererythrobacter sp. BO-6 TaxID=2604537 RepID=UPI001F494F16|nr:hypothetical protein [Altererythrobacter sp. BO-6]